MIHRHKNLHTSAPNPCASALHIDRDQATTHLEALCFQLDDIHRATQSTSAIGEVL